MEMEIEQMEIEPSNNKPLIDQINPKLIRRKKLKKIISSKKYRYFPYFF